MRKFMLLAAIVSFLLGTAVPVIALALSPAEEAKMQAEMPLSQADIDAFIRYGPSLIRAFNADDTSMASTIMLQTGWNKIRGTYVISKIGNGYAINIQPLLAKAMLEGAGMPAVLV